MTTGPLPVLLKCSRNFPFFLSIYTAAPSCEDYVQAPIRPKANRYPIMLYKITYDLVTIPLTDCLTPNHRQSKFVHPLAYRQISTSTNYCKYSFFPRTAVHWNALSLPISIAGIFLAILGRGPRAFLIGKISEINPEFGKFSEYSKLIIFSKLT